LDISWTSNDGHDGDSPRRLNRFSYINVTVHHVVPHGKAVYRHITARKL
jgi:hypothetical protein